MSQHIISPKDIAKTKEAMCTYNSLITQTGQYDHTHQRRWVGKDPQLIRWTLVSDTLFDGELK